MAKSSDRVDVRELIPEGASLNQLRRIAGDCTGCDLHKSGTQTVFEEGPRQADLMLVGEQPGDQEDKQGHPFVGPVGRLLQDALERAGFPWIPYDRAALGPDSYMYRPPLIP